MKLDFKGLLDVVIVEWRIESERVGECRDGCHDGDCDLDKARFGNGWG